MSDALTAASATFVIFGAFGDLARRLLIPALVNLARAGLLNEDMALVGVSHHDSDDEHLREALDEFVKDDANWPWLRSRIRYLKGDFADTTMYQALGSQLTGNAIFYLATAPAFFGTVVNQLGDAGLLNETDGFRRVVIKKRSGPTLPPHRR